VTTSWTTTHWNRTALVRVSEHRGFSIKGIVLKAEHPAFELLFDDHASVPEQLRIHPEVRFTCLGVFLGKRTYAEYQLGRWFIRPKDDAMIYVQTLLLLTRGYRPEFFLP